MGEKSLRPIKETQGLRRRLSLKDELILALLPMSIVLIVFLFVEALSNQWLLFASLASSAFLIYLDPQHGTNSIRTLVISEMIAAGLGLTIYSILSLHYVSAAMAMILTIF